MPKRKALVVGAGIAGLAMSRILAMEQFDVTIIERDAVAVGASIRNFGMVWPVGQPSGQLYQAALRSAEIWKQVAAKAGFFIDPVGSLHLAYHADEAAVLEELRDAYSGERDLQVLTPAEVAKRSPRTVINKLICGLYSPTETIVDPREAIAAIPRYLEQEYGVKVLWNHEVMEVHTNKVKTNRGVFEADLVVVCSGISYDLLFPEAFEKVSATRCKLQMLRFGPQPGGERIGPAICGGLSLVHYNSFKRAPSLEQLRERYARELPDYLEWGIHVMVSQNGKGELTVGDSHEYGPTHDPFDRRHINDLILGYLKQFCSFSNEQVIETWNGTYTKLTNGDPYLFKEVLPGVYVFNGLGGAGMTLSFGLAEELVRSI